MEVTLVSLFLMYSQPSELYLILVTCCSVNHGGHTGLSLLSLLDAVVHGGHTRLSSFAKLQALVYNILPLEEGAGKRYSECDWRPVTWCPVNHVGHTRLSPLHVQSAVEVIPDSRYLMPSQPCRSYQTLVTWCSVNHVGHTTLWLHDVQSTMKVIPDYRHLMFSQPWRSYHTLVTWCSVSRVGHTRLSLLDAQSTM